MKLRKKLFLRLCKTSSTDRMNGHWWRHWWNKLSNWPISQTHFAKWITYIFLKKHKIFRRESQSEIILLLKDRLKRARERKPQKGLLRFLKAWKQFWGHVTTYVLICASLPCYACQIASHRCVRFRDSRL